MEHPALEPISVGGGQQEHDQRYSQYPPDAAVDPRPPPVRHLERRVLGAGDQHRDRQIGDQAVGAVDRDQDEEQEPEERQRPELGPESPMQRQQGEQEDTPRRRRLDQLGDHPHPPQPGGPLPQALEQP